MFSLKIYVHFLFCIIKFSGTTKNIYLVSTSFDRSINDHSQDCTSYRLPISAAGNFRRYTTRFGPRKFPVVEIGKRYDVQS